MSWSVTRNECEGGPHFADSIHNSMTISDLTVCQCLIMSLSFCHPLPLGHIALVSGSWHPAQLAAGILVALQRWACRIPFRKVIGTSHAGVQALTCHRLAGMPLLKRMWLAFHSVSSNPQILSYVLYKSFPPSLSSFFFFRFKCKRIKQQWVWLTYFYGLLFFHFSVKHGLEKRSYRD